MSVKPHPWPHNSIEARLYKLYPGYPNEWYEEHAALTVPREQYEKPHESDLASN
jgi:hypothetical protein